MFKHLIPKFVPMEERLLGKVNPLNDFSLLGFWPEVVLGSPKNCIPTNLNNF